MKSSITQLLLAGAMCCLVSAAMSDDQSSTGSTMQMQQQGAMTMPTPGPESKALDKFFGSNATWTGTCPAGAMGPDSKAMTTKGSAMCKPMFGGFGYTCDVTDQMGSGKTAMTWKGHMLVAYDMGTKTYRGTCLDNMGTFTVWNGTLDGDKFTLETPEPVMMMGQSMKDRLTWTMNADGTCAFTDEHQMAGSSDWMTFETATMKNGRSHSHSEHMATSEKK